MLSSMYSRISRWRAVRVTSAISGTSLVGSSGRSATGVPNWRLPHRSTGTRRRETSVRRTGGRSTPLTRNRRSCWSGSDRTAVPATGVRSPNLSHPLRKITSWPRSSPPHPTTRSSATAGRTSAWSPAGRRPRPRRRPTASPGRRRPPRRARCSPGVAAVASAGSPPLAEPAPPARRRRPPRPAGRPVVVRPGDTFWTIARRVQPTGDVRPLVDRLVAGHGSTSCGPATASPSRRASPSSERREPSARRPAVDRHRATAPACGRRTAGTRASARALPGLRRPRRPSRRLPRLRRRHGDPTTA